MMEGLRHIVSHLGAAFGYHVKSSLNVLIECLAAYKKTIGAIKAA